MSTEATTLATINDLRDLLQRAHFAARLEDTVRPDPRDRLADQIHVLRTLAEQVARRLDAQPVFSRVML